jgi:4-diphosphocytidyl-2-C-methyl-D-erythritol kinase
VSSRLSLLSPAKLNLFLHVTGQREDGYHELQTLFQLLEWGDQITLELADAGGITLAQQLDGVLERDNLIIKAARRLTDHLTEQPNVVIHVEKNIPMGAGLGGGSSNAATALLGLNTLLGLDRSLDELAEIGASLGADVPVFIYGKTAWAEGIGDQLTPLELPVRWYTIVCPGCHVSTQAVFSAPELTRDTPPITIPAFFEGGVRNDLQSVVTARYPEVRNALISLEELAPAMMTGSGACVFSSFDNEAAARRVAAELAPRFDVVVARGVNKHPDR